jgi:hypothetical protein
VRWDASGEVVLILFTIKLHGPAITSLAAPPTAHQAVTPAAQPDLERVFPNEKKTKNIRSIKKTFLII